MQKDMIAAADRFLTSNPEPQRKHAAQQLIVAGYQQLGDGAGLNRVLSDMKPPTPQMAVSLAMMTGARYAETIGEKLGTQAGLDALARAESMLNLAELKTEQEKQQGETAILYLATGRSGLLEKAGKKEEALQALADAQAKLPPDSRAAKQIAGKINLARIVGAEAPPIKVERQYGEFRGLESYRGKVVVLDFTAHW